MRLSPRSAGERGSAVVDFVLVLLVLLPLFLGLVQLGLVLYVRNTVAAAAADGARYGARLGHRPADGALRARAQLDGVIGDRFIDGVRARERVIGPDAVDVVEVRIRVRIPALGLAGPAIEMELSGHGIREVVP